jgi:hypothetical protein
VRYTGSQGQVVAKGKLLLAWKHNIAASAGLQGIERLL